MLVAKESILFCIFCVLGRERKSISAASHGNCISGELSTQDNRAYYCEAFYTWLSHFVKSQIVINPEVLSHFLFSGV